MAGSQRKSPTIVPVACLRDNYGYLVFSEQGNGDCVLVDASEAAPIEREMRRLGLRLRAILTTHHHWDHIGGNLHFAAQAARSASAKQAKGELPIYGHSSELGNIPGLNRPLEHGDHFEVAGLQFSVLHVRGHTQGGLVYCLEEACFTGDTLFCGGCGRLKQGTAEQLHHSLTQTLAVLPDSMQFYCGHEYTLANLEFASRFVQGPAMQQRLADVRGRRARGEFCASASLGLERATNPFLRCHTPELQAAVGAREERACFAALRRLKDEA